MTLFSSQGSTAFAVNTYANDVDISRYVGLGSDFTFRVEESGGTQPGQCEISVLDMGNSLSSVTDEAYLRIQKSGVDMFRGFIRSRQPRIVTFGRVVHVTATDVSSVLDKTIVVSNQRASGESDSDRIKYFLSTYAPTVGAWLNSDVSKIRTLNASMPAQKFRYMTLRQAIEHILGRASTSSNYYVDASGRLHTFDSDHPEGDTAPYAINVAHTLSAGQVAPELLQIDFDTASLINDYWVRGKTSAGSGRYSDATSISLYGVRSAFIDGPDSSTSADASALGNAALRDTAYPIARGSFSLHSPYDANGGLLWRAGQTVTITSTQHGITAKPYRVMKVSSEFTDGTGKRKIDVEFGGLRLRLNGGGTYVPGSAMNVGF